ncbi:MAG TPA: hypothetical protein VFZ53_25990 [Polyangiaceae bacterium]
MRQTLGLVAALAAVIPFPMHRVRRRRTVTDVFAPLRDASELERAGARLWWSCAGMTTLLSVVLQLSLG